MEKENLVPKVRFKGFSEPWEQRKFIEIASRVSVTSDDDALPHIEFSDIISNEGRLKESFYSKKPDNRIGIRFIRNDILYGKLRPYLNNWLFPQFEGVSVGDFWVFRSKDDISKSFLYSLIQSSKYQQVANVSTGTKMPRSDWKTVSKTDFPIPLNFIEQRRIGEAFQALNNLIAANEDKLKQLKELKELLMQKIFSQEWRFKGFTDPWEQRKLGDLANIVRGASPRPIKDPKWFSDTSDIGWLRIADVTAQHGRIHYLDQHLSQKGQEKTRVLTTQHLLLSIAATVGKPVMNYIKTGVHDGFLIFLNPVFDLEFMFQWLEFIRNSWNRYGQPGSQVNLNSDLVKNQLILIPNDSEQQLVSALMQKTDSFIAANEDKLKQLKEMKRFLMQNLFI